MQTYSDLETMINEITDFVGDAKEQNLKVDVTSNDMNESEFQAIGFCVSISHETGKLERVKNFVIPISKLRESAFLTTIFGLPRKRISFARCLNDILS
jgi:hypothetical protein